MNVLLPAVVLADDDEQEQLVHLVDERREPLEVGARSVRPRERVAHVQHELPLGATSSACCG